ncbi:importin-beta domain-containing protein [Apiospora arundinis]
MTKNSKTTPNVQSRASTPDSCDPRPRSRGSRMAVRVSLACVQCRSKHMKCDATLPACKRCTGEGKPCFYAKSRRGIRDQKKRSLISDRPVSVPKNSNSLGWSLPARNAPGSGAPPENPTSLDAYYNCFHVAHPFILPKRYLMKEAMVNSGSTQFLLTVINYIGALYASEIRSDELRDAAYAAACAPLPITPQSVQGLLIMSLAALGNDALTYYGGWLNRANTMAQNLGMHKKLFAATTPDPVIAESYRRTYWGLYWLNVCRNNFFEKQCLGDLQGDVDLPCEEWEYESGGVFERTDSLLCEFILKLPAWKVDLVNPEGSADIVLQQTIGMAHNARLKIRDNIARDNMSLRESCSLGPRTGPSVGARKVKCFGWHAINTEIQLANSMLAIFTKPLDLRHFTPLLMPSIRSMALVYLDACVFQGLDTPIYREKLTMLLRILTVHGKVWKASRSFLEELRDVVAEYLLTPVDSPAPSQDVIWPSASDATAAASDHIGESGGFDFPDLDALGSLEDWEPTGGQLPVNI